MGPVGTVGTVLVVEDNDDSREMVAWVLREEGFRVYEAIHGRHALEILENMSEPPCVILLDMMMPVMDGAEFLAAAGDKLSTIPVVIASAAETEHTRGRRKLPKPISIEALLEVVTEYCGEHPSRGGQREESDESEK
jgi:CheY-like chemotaxis protein